MRPFVVAAALALSGVRLAHAATDPVESELVALETQSWVAWKAHDAKFFDRFLSADHVEMQGAGPVGKQPVLEGVAAGCEVKSYALGPMTFTRFSPDTALITYRAEQDTVCGGQKVLSPVWATSLFVRRDGVWRNALYIHSPAQRATQ